MKSKTIFIALALLITAQGVNAGVGTWTFTAKLANPTDTLWILPTDNLKALDVVTKTDGVFQYTKDIDKVKEFFVTTPAMIRHEPEGFSLIVTAVPGATLLAEGFCNNKLPANGLTFSGSKFYDHYAELEMAQAKVLEIKDAQPAIDYIKTYPTNENAAILIGTVGCYCPDRLDETLALLSPDIRSGGMKTYIDESIETAKEFIKQQENQGKVLPVGSMAPDFTLKDLSGKPLTLSSLRGKMLILDFWGSWCGWCIKGFPKMKKYYEKYKEHLEILGVDCNDTEEKWQAAVKKHELPWKHVFVPKNSSVTNDYFITGFPTKIIISSEGKILTTIVGEDPKFYDLLDEMFKD
ncbi:MAG: TlpA family protein disulfide reductase [Bacteroidaceae bacterium]|nr:TlpA family protein disulfide reductase [Bacteroidaceae bacterium]